MRAMGGATAISIDRRRRGRAVQVSGGRHRARSTVAARGGPCPRPRGAVRRPAPRPNVRTECRPASATMRAISAWPYSLGSSPVAGRRLLRAPSPSDRSGANAREDSEPTARVGERGDRRLPEALGSWLATNRDRRRLRACRDRPEGTDYGTSEEFEPIRKRPAESIGDVDSTMASRRLSDSSGSRPGW
jgi:hypothetical protein